ncbi:MAG TPA: amidohydrolase family protein [Gammaproteobacteria bacterium]|nr:amidohydrolase family protein [Gammaproteobacteria bacterium]
MRQMSLCALFMAGCLAVMSPLRAAPATASEVVALKAAHLFDGVSGKLVDHGVVVVENGKITAVGNDVKVPANARVIDLGNATLTPGFIDAHVHLGFQGSDNWYRDFYHSMMRFPAEQALYGAQYARRTLEAGFTTVRDLGSTDYISLGLRNAINAGVIEGPRMLIANYAIGSTGGHADQAPFPPQLVEPAGPIQGVCNGPAECRAAVRYQIKYGADVIKFMPSGGVLSLSDPVDVPELTQAEMDAIVSEAHAWHRKVAAHCHGDEAAKMAIKAGVDSIEHGTFLKDDTLREMKRKGVYLVPTLFAGAWVGEKANEFPPAIAVKARAAAAQMQLMFQRAVKIGVPIAFGTDAGVEPHGLDAREFALMVKNGLSPAAALMAATHNAAQLLGIAAETGTLAVGKDADIVAVPGNPLADIHDTEHPVFVMKQGVIVVGGN